MPWKSYREKWKFLDTFSMNLPSGLFAVGPNHGSSVLWGLLRFFIFISVQCSLPIPVSDSVNLRKAHKVVNTESLSTHSWPVLHLGGKREAPILARMLMGLD